MKSRILNIVLVLVLATLPMSANAGWSEAQQATYQTLPAPAMVEQSPAPDVDFKSSPVMFIENVGQWDDGARFQVWGGPAGTMWLAEDAIWITVVEPGETSRQVDRVLDPMARWLPEDQEDLAPRRGANIKLSFVGANPHPRIETFDRLDTTVSYFYGNDPEQWRPDVPVWGGVRYVELYPGIDLEVTDEAGKMTSRLTARSEANLSLVRLHVEGATMIEVEQGELWLASAAGSLALPLPYANFLYRVDGLTEAGQAGSWHAAPRATDISVSSAPTDDPVDLFYSTFLGGSSGDPGYGIVVDGAGSAYVTGTTNSGNFPTTPGAFDPGYNGGYVDAFVVKLNPTGSNLIYATFLGGSLDDRSWAIALDRADSAYIAGGTTSSNFPTTPGAFDTSYNGSDAFVAKLNPDGSELAYATFLGGIGSDAGYGIAVDEAGSGYVTGATDSGDFPTTPGAFDTSYDGSDAFVVKLNPAGSGLAYGTFLGGGLGDRGWAISVDGNGSAYVSGGTGSSNFPTTSGAFDTSFNGSAWDAFVVKLNPTGSGLAYASFLGGNGDEESHGLAVDGNGNAYATGHTYSSDFPTTPGAFDPSYNLSDAFVVKLNSAGSGLMYATYLGGNNTDYGYGIVVDEAGSAFVTGYTLSSNFPTTPNAFDPSFNGGYIDAFLVKLSAVGSSLTYGTFLGGNDEDYGFAAALDRAGSAYLTGDAGSSNFPTTPGAFDPGYNGGAADAFVVKLAALGTGGTLSISGSVRDQANQPISEVIITAGSAGSVMTDNTGAFLIPNLMPGWYTLVASKAGLSFTPSQRLVVVDDNITAEDFRGTTDGGPPNPFLDLPFDYDGSEANYRQALKNWDDEGRINSWFDHKYPDYSKVSGIWLYRGDPHTENFEEMSGVPCYENFCYDGHNGVDFSRPEVANRSSWPVLAAANGVVITPTFHSGYGRNLILYHDAGEGNGYFTRYAHLDTISVTTGITVSALYTIGLAGNSGSGGAGYHLHFGVYRDDGDGRWEPSQDKAVDPFGWERTNLIDPWVQDRSGATSHYLWIYDEDEELYCPLNQTTIIDDPLAGTHIRIAPNTFPGQIRLRYSPGWVALPLDGLFSSGYAFDLQVLEWIGVGTHVPDSIPSEIPLTSPITVTVAYSDTALTHLDESQLAIYHWDSELTMWHPLATIVDTQTNIVVAQAETLGGFDLQAPLLCSTDAFEPDDGYQAARLVWPNDWPLTRGLDIPNDSDWITVQAAPGVAYTIRTQNLAGGADTVVNLYDMDAVTLLASDDNTGGGLASEIHWTAPYSGTYFIETASAPGGATNCSATYELTVSTIPGDVIADCQVDVMDLQAVAERWQLSEANPDPDSDLETPNYETRFDLNRDGVITVIDIQLVLAQWGQVCP